MRPSLEARFWANVEKTDGCWKWTGYKNHDGYGRINISRAIMAHRLSWIIHNGPIPEGMRVCHKCDEHLHPLDTSYRACVNPDHLFLGTQRDNILDMERKGRGRHLGVPGERNGCAKLTVDKVRQIRAIGRSKPQSAIAREFGMTQTMVSRILNGKAWIHAA
jgi:hypothetical protein